MPKTKTKFVCASCGHEELRWMGKCPDCGAWNTLEEIPEAPVSASKNTGRFLSFGSGGAQKLSQIQQDQHIYTKTGIDELDRVLGGGIVEGSVILIGGEPGIGKSTLLLQVCANLSGQNKKVLYVSGEESLRQIKLRADRLGKGEADLMLLSENVLSAVEEQLSAFKPDFCVIDSIQTMVNEALSGTPGSVSQVRECANALLKYAKNNHCAMFLVGHVTKEGSLAGPRVLEHMVDAVIYFEGDRKHEYRLVRAIKNRFGSVNELGVFEMKTEGLFAVSNPSETLVSQRAKGASGSCVLCAMEGSRPVLADIQALVAQSFYAVPRRTVNGMDNSRIMLLLAVLEKRGGLKLFNKDVYVNVAGGLSLDEPAADLAVCIAATSSYYDKILSPDLAVMGEVGLAGEIRAVPSMDRRVAECVRLGFTKILCPKDNTGKFRKSNQVTILGVDTLAQAIAVLDIKSKE